MTAFDRQRDAKGLIDRKQWDVDGSNIRAHRCAWGTTKSAPLEPEDHGLGYSKGGFGTKLHVVDGGQAPLNVIGTPGQTHETTQFETASKPFRYTHG